MTQRLTSFADMAALLAKNEIGMAGYLSRGLERVATKIENTARSEFGHYQDAVGPHPGWPELAEATKDDRVREGYSENDPLLRSGETMNSFSHQTEGLESLIGSTSEKMVWFEFGTGHMPSRPVLGPAVVRNEGAIRDIVGAALVSGLVGTELAGAKVLSQVHHDLGYDVETKD